VEKGGIFLKDAAVISGIGIIGRNNLLVHPQWGPRIRLRAVLLESRFEPTGVCTDFTPCDHCGDICRKACPREAYAEGPYSRSACNEQMNADMANRLACGELMRDGRRDNVVSYCRACELACPVGA
jgi:epoxyqueuosine reductase